MEADEGPIRHWRILNKSYAIPGCSKFLPPSYIIASLEMLIISPSSEAVVDRLINLRRKGVPWFTGPYSCKG